MGSPIATSGHIPHWSRWEKSATTFGPTGRVVASVILLSMLLPAISYGNIVFVLTFPVAAAVVLKEVWAKGWVVPDEPDLPALPVRNEPRPRLTTEEQARRIVRWTLGLGALLVFAYGPVPAKAAVLALAAIALPWWFFRGFLDR